MGFGTTNTRFLIVSAAQRLCALNIAEVIETFRPLPIVPVAGTPGFVRGVSLIRGGSVPVVDLGELLEGVAQGAQDAVAWRPVARSQSRRMVTLNLGARTVALLVDGVLGVRSLDASHLAVAPALLGALSSELLSALGQLDGQLLVVLHSSHVVPADVWALLASASSASASSASAPEHAQQLSRQRGPS